MIKRGDPPQQANADGDDSDNPIEWLTGSGRDYTGPFEPLERPLLAQAV